MKRRNNTCTSQDHEHTHLVSILNKKPIIIFAKEKEDRVMKMHQTYITFCIGVGEARYTISFGEYSFDKSKFLYEDLIQNYF